MAAFLALTALRTGLPHITPSEHWTHRLFGVSTRSLRLMSVIAFWGVAPFLIETWLGRQLLKVSGLAFFLHAIHWPMNQFFKFGIADVITSTGDIAMLTELSCELTFYDCDSVVRCVHSRDIETGFTLAPERRTLDRAEQPSRANGSGPSDNSDRK